MSSLTHRSVLGVSLVSLSGAGSAQRTDPVPPAAPGAAGSGDTRAPFGLTWGLSSEETRKDVGATLRPSEDQGRWGSSFAATGLSRALSDTESIILSYGFRDRLFRVVAIGRPNGPDPSGGATLNRYQELSGALASRYGRGNEQVSRDTQIWKAPNEYVMSLTQGRAHRFTIFANQAVEVELSMRDQSIDKSYYVIIFTSIPGKAEFDQDKKQRECDSL